MITRNITILVNINLEGTKHGDERFNQRLSQLYGTEENFFYLSAYGIMQRYLNHKIIPGGKFALSTTAAFKEDKDLPLFICSLGANGFQDNTFTVYIVSCYLVKSSKLVYTDNEGQKRKWACIRDGSRTENSPLILVVPGVAPKDAVHQNGTICTVSSSITFKINCENTQDYFKYGQKLNIPNNLLSKNSVNTLYKAFPQFFSDYLISKGNFCDEFVVVDSNIYVYYKFDGFDNRYMAFSFIACLTGDYNKETKEIFEKTGVPVYQVKKGIGCAGYQQKNVIDQINSQNHGFVLNQNGKIIPPQNLRESLIRKNIRIFFENL